MTVLEIVQYCTLNDIPLAAKVFFKDNYGSYELTERNLGYVRGVEIGKPDLIELDIFADPNAYRGPQKNIEKTP